MLNKNIFVIILGWKWWQLLRHWPTVWGEHIPGGRARHHGREHFLAPLPPGSEPWASGEMPGGDQEHPGGWVVHHLVRSASLNINSSSPPGILFYSFFWYLSDYSTSRYVYMEALEAGYHFAFSSRPKIIPLPFAKEVHSTACYLRHCFSNHSV